jgi:plasmid maintenance system antidote protein VapI
MYLDRAKIRFHASRVGLHQYELSSRIGYDPSRFSMMVMGHVPVTAELAAKIADVLRVRPEEILRDDAVAGGPFRE